MNTTITLTKHNYAALKRFLFKGTAEQAAFLFCDCLETSGALNLAMREAYYIPPSEFTIQSAYHIELCDSVRPAIIKRAWDARRAIAEIHSHRGKGWHAQFSPSDLSGFREFVPHIR